jgi:rSAM/selenodomain-associated transferase 1
MKADILTHLAMFAKYWQLGQVKTRLASSVGAAAARDVYLVLLQHLVKRFSRFGDQRTVVFSPPESRPQFRDLLPGEWDLEEQAQGDLGNRLRTFLTDNLDTHGTKLIVIGSDTPDLPVSYVARAVDLLSEFPVVIGPSQDGGYYLIGMCRLVPDIFDGITWSTNQVLRQTIERLHNRNCPYGLLPSLNDVDELADLMQLMNKLRNNERDRLDDELLRKLERLELPHA